MQTPGISRSHSTNRLKFKQIINYRQGNELNNKYQLYKTGTPNQYSDDLNVLKSKNIKNDVSSMQIPTVDYIINQFSVDSKVKHINKRNYQLYPNMIKQPSGRYKEILSEKQEIKDFIIWFQNQYQAIQKNTQANVKKFQDKQTLIAAGFNEMTGQVAKVSKNRCQILKMLWNRKNSEDESIIELLNNQFIKKEKGYLMEINNIHQQYQNEIESLRKENKTLLQKSDKENLISKNCIVNIRSQRKKIKKMQYLMKKLHESNINVKRQNFNLIEENIKLLMNMKEIKEEEAIILNYRKMQIHKQKDLLKEHKLKKLMKLAEDENLGNGVNIQHLQDKKQSLYDYFIERLKQNPDEKVLIKEEYFIDDQEDNHVGIQSYFKNIINRPSIQVELLNQISSSNLFRDKAVNTNAQTAVQYQVSPLSFDKSVQVQFSEENAYQYMHKYTKITNSTHSAHHENKKYQIIDERQEINVQKESKKRMAKHIISRKNSLCLLELNSLGQINNKLYEKKVALISAFNKSHLMNESIMENQDQNKESNVKKQEKLCQEIQDEDSFLQNITLKQKTSQCKDLLSINIKPNMNLARKSAQFNNLLNKINESCVNSNAQGVQIKIVKPQCEEKMIKMEEESEESLRLTQIQDLIRKHLLKNQQCKIVKNPEKPLNKIFMSLFKNISKKNNINFIFQLVQVIKNSYGNMKTVLWRFLSLINIIRYHSNSSSLLKIISIILKINEKYAIYDEINTQEIGNLYFKLFFYLTIRQVNDNSFNLWKASTTLSKIKNMDFIYILEEYFSSIKRQYIEKKLEEIICFSQSEFKKKKNSEQHAEEYQENKIIKLNPIILYIFQTYLIEKKLYYNSYYEMIDFVSEDEGISSEIIIWMFDIFGFSEAKQRELLQFLFMTKRKDKKHQENERQVQNYITKYVKKDDFYRCCIKFDFPIYEELSISTFSQFKLLPQTIQTNYYRMIELEQWKEIKINLLKKCKQSCQSKIYFSAYENILNKLQYQILKGNSIYGLQQSKLKKKQQIFALFYKIIIIQAHKNLMPVDLLAFP